MAKKRTKANYIDNKQLEKELTHLSETFKADTQRIMKEQKLSLKAAEKLAKGEMTEELGEMFLKIAYNLSNKNNFNNYTFKEEMIGLAIEYLCRFAKRYDGSKKNANAFSYCTQICYNGFLQEIEKQAKRAKLKDTLIKKAMERKEIDKWQQEEKGFMYEDDDCW